MKSLTFRGMNVLFVGEIVGKPGITCAKKIKDLREKHHVDFVIANAEGATGGFGLGKAHAIQLHKLGIDVLTGGEKIYFKLDMVDFIAKNNWILRPVNYPAGNPGRGIRIYPVGEKNLVVINLLGTSSFNRVHLNNPFGLIQTTLEKMKNEIEHPVFLVQFHASTTAEKQTMGFMLDGQVSAVIGTHTKVMSADAKILAGGTAYITDNGRTGSQMSIGGFANDVELRKVLTSIPERSRENWNQLELQAVLVRIGDDAKATAIEPIKVACENPGMPEGNE